MRVLTNEFGMLDTCQNDPLRCPKSAKAPRVKRVTGRAGKTSPNYAESSGIVAIVLNINFGGHSAFVSRRYSFRSGGGKRPEHLKQARRAARSRTLSFGCPESINSECFTCLNDPLRCPKSAKTLQALSANGQPKKQLRIILSHPESSRIVLSIDLGSLWVRYRVRYSFGSGGRGAPGCVPRNTLAAASRSWREAMVLDHPELSRNILKITLNNLETF
jgi:hypothetical protein